MGSRLPAGGRLGDTAHGTIENPSLIRWFNPPNGEWGTTIPLDAAENSFAAPDLNDWVLWVSVKAMMK